MKKARSIPPGMPVHIHWFSGTGNTLLIAETLEDTFRARGYEVRLIPIECIDPKEIDPSAVCGFAVPVAGQSTYPFIWEFLEKLPQVPGTPCFFADTLAMYSGGILGPVKRLLRRKGFRPLGAREFIMPNNFLRRKALPEHDKSLSGRGEERAAAFAELLIRGKAHWWDIPFYSDMMSFWFRNRGMVRLLLRILPVRIDPSRCSACGTCVALCPEHSLTLKEGANVPVNSDRCTLCHRCFAYCPENAVTIGRKERFRYKAVDLAALRKRLSEK